MHGYAMFVILTYSIFRWFRKFEAIADDEDSDARNISPVNVSHVNFDETKPLPKQIGDGLASTSSKKCTSNAQENKNSINGQNDHDAESIIPTKGKIRRQSKSMENAYKHTQPTSRPSKIHKKNG